jgi:hypothetical protein
MARTFSVVVAATWPLGPAGASHAEERCGWSYRWSGAARLGDIHAFGDSNLYLQRTKEDVILSSEHRAAPASAPVYLELVTTDVETTHLEVIAEPQGEEGRGLKEQALDLLAQGQFLTRTKLRDTQAVKNERLGAMLDSLGRAGQVCRTAPWLAASPLIDLPKQTVPFPSRDGERNGPSAASHAGTECGNMRSTCRGFITKSDATRATETWSIRETENRLSWSDRHRLPRPLSVAAIAISLPVSVRYNSLSSRQWKSRRA